ncbi:prolyl aminopeptidase [Corynebacterium choanae]|uniref:Proline iminopeptidase n=1 Tax=Corynebacterium choanae TaxID=1862358 RepID=A0A3G6J7B7_9CORY|nr:prolyl aminopeptidase [Corynebacterium choanae]AZA14005.1 Proline iminopeptidase [Corynebacterium choanae]
MATFPFLYDAPEPFDSGMLDVGDGQSLYYEQVGNPAGLPAVFIHGGPGGGITAQYREFFDPARYRVVLFDQRGCGNSTPNIADPDVDVAANLAVNTTWHLVADLERLRTHLGIDEWLVFGGSWGSTLALTYAAEHPDRVKALVLRGIFLLRRSELDFYYNGGAAHLFPEQWQEYLAPIDAALRPSATDQHGRTHLDGVDLIGVYHELLHDDDRQVVARAARAWSVWEGSTSRLHIPQDLGDHGQERFDIAFARIENHYFVNGGFFEDGYLLKPETVDRIRHIPAVIVQGRYDVVCPAISAWQLAKLWPEATLQITPDAGHAAMEPANAKALVEATDRFATTLLS